MKTDINRDLTVNKGLRFPVMESFATVQGEGYHTGKPAYFIRLGGCDVGCHWCDVKESWDADHHDQRSVGELMDEICIQPSDLVVITGGEPMMYDLDILTRSISESGKKVHLETSGVYTLSGKWDWICFSPKKFKKPKSEYYENSDELKVVIYHPSDFEFAELHAGQMGGNVQLFLQPEWSVRHKIMPLIVEYIKSNPKWRVSLQTHKYLNIP